MNEIQQATEREACRKAFEFDLIDNWMYTPSDFERNEVCMYLDDELEFAWECAWASWQEARKAEQPLRDALQKIIDMNVDYCLDRFGDKDKAENMACVRVAREALAGNRPLADRA